MGLNTGQKFGSYEIVKLLGRGGMGEVYLATDTRLNRNVAIKILSSNILPSSQLLERFRREAGLSAALNHPNICTIYETGEVDGQTYICMEYVEGITLREKLRHAPMNLQEVLDTAIQIADALDEARKKSIVHRDIKTGNILLTSRSLVKILDFGLAKLVRDNSDDELSKEITDTHLTKTGEVRGTAAYMSPEQALGRKVDHRSDIFSFGIVLYEMLAGRLPFSGNSTTEVVDAILHKDPLPVTRFNNDVPDALIRVLNKMLQKDAELRYQSIHEVWVDLKGIQSEGKSSSQTIRKGPGWWEGRSFPFWPAAILAVVVLALLSFTWIRSSRNQNQTESQPPSAVASNKRVEIAVLPFRYAGDDPTRSYLAPMVTDALIAGLQVVPGIAVAPFQNVRELQKDPAISNIARHVGVGSIVKGLVTTKGEETEITAEIISENGEVLSKQTFTGTSVATLDLINKNILSVLKVSDGSARQIDQVRTPSVDAYKKYLEARNYQEGWDVVNNLDRAIELYREAIQTDPDFAAARASLAMTLISQFHKTHDASYLTAANTESKRALALDPDLPEAYLAYGMVQLDSGKSIEAREAFSKALELAPGDDSACRSLGVMYASLGRNQEAREMHRRAIELRPDYWRNHYDLGRFEWQFAGNLHAARLHMEKANQIHPEGFAPLIGLGLVNLTQGNFEAAESYFRKTLEQSPNVYAYNNLGLIYYYRGQYELALRNWQALLKEAPDKPLNMANVADALRQLGRQEESKRYYTQAINGFRSLLQANQSEDKWRGGIAMALAATGKCTEAMDIIRGIASKHPDSTELTDYSLITVSRCSDWDWAKRIALASIATNNLMVVRFDPDVQPVRETPEVKAALEKQIKKSTISSLEPQS
jgi:serine/threonine protein kinase/tetratricopeptide (TPR) repeat protein